MTHADTLLDLINEHPEGLDDDELSKESVVKSSQQVYDLCTRLAAEGKIRRLSVYKAGKRRKIHNFPTSGALPPSSKPHRGRLKVEDSTWRKRLSMLVAATGRDEDELLDEALVELAKTILQEEVKTHEP